MKLRVLFLAAWICLMIVALTTASDKSGDKHDHDQKGAANIVIEAQGKENVPFTHREHQEKLEDCNLCHDLFPHESGVIKKMKAEGKLAGKEVMNKKCVGCHRERQREGKPSGPTSCSKCHTK